MLTLPTDTETDISLIHEILNGRTEIFETLVRRYNPVLYKIARTYGFDHEASEDLMQETHVSAYFALSQFEGRSSYKTWITRIMINKCCYQLKSAHTKNEIPSGSFFEPNPVQLKASSKNKSETILLRELHRLIENGLQNIPEIYRTVFMLRVMEGFSVKETSALLHISQANVKIRLKRAKGFMQRHLKKFYSSKDLYSFNLIYCDGMVSKVMEEVNPTYSPA